MRLKAPSCVNRIPSLTSTGTCSNISCKHVLKKSTYFVPVSFPSRKKGPMKNLSIIPAHMMSRMHNHTWVFFIPIMIIMKIECTIPGKTSLLEFALFIKFIISHKRRQIGHVFIWLFSIIFRRTISSRNGSPQVTKHPVYTSFLFLLVDTPSCLFPSSWIYIGSFTFTRFRSILDSTALKCS